MKTLLAITNSHLYPFRIPDLLKSLMVTQFHLAISLTLLPLNSRSTNTKKNYQCLSPNLVTTQSYLVFLGWTFMISTSDSTPAL